MFLRFSDVVCKYSHFSRKYNIFHLDGPIYQFFPRGIHRFLRCSEQGRCTSRLCFRKLNNAAPTQTYFWKGVVLFTPVRRTGVNDKIGLWRPKLRFKFRKCQPMRPSSFGIFQTSNRLVEDSAEQIGIQAREASQLLNRVCLPGLPDFRGYFHAGHLP